eukprot:TRINITY_DN54661_c0_g1_i1.p1 TRINITY_DN54661_c0_g1~~TRINITY_DN54661_c0_g1_i1.p1  ORF type:complete len:509 (+),score=31.23 TRINITY_DN54661_c0_g1_i1:189-1529(+)
MKDLRLWFTAAGELVKLMVIELTAEELLYCLECGIANLPAEASSLLHVSSSLKYKYDLTRYCGNRLVQAWFDGTPLKRSHSRENSSSLPRTFRCVVTPNFARWFAPNAPRLLNEEGAVSLIDVVMRRLEQVREVNESNAPIGRFIHHESRERALGEPLSGLPAISSDFDASREMYRNADTLLGFRSESWRGSPIMVGSNNYSKLLRMAEVFGAHGMPVELTQSSLPYHKRWRPIYDVGAPTLTSVEVSSAPSLFERDCIGKALAYPSGVLVAVSGLCIEPRPASHRSDQWFFTDDTPVGTAIYIKDRIQLRDSIGKRYRFRPSRSLEEFVGKSASFAVLFGRVVGDQGDGFVTCEFFDGGTVNGTIVAPRGVDGPAPCLPYEYVFVASGSGGRTIAEVRGEEWTHLIREQQPRFLDAGPYAVAARRFVTGVPSWTRRIRVGIPSVA